MSRHLGTPRSAALLSAVSHGPAAAAPPPTSWGADSITLTKRGGFFDHFCSRLAVLTCARTQRRVISPTHCGRNYLKQGFFARRGERKAGKRHGRIDTLHYGTSYPGTATSSMGARRLASHVTRVESLVGDASEAVVGGASESRVESGAGAPGGPRLRARGRCWRRCPRRL